MADTKELPGNQIIREQQEFQARQSAVHLASQRLGPSASVDDVLKEAEKIVAFMQGGGQVAAPKK